MVEFFSPSDEARAKEFSDLQKKKADSLKELQEEKEKGLDELKKRELALEALKREKEAAEKKLKALAEREKAKSEELELEEKNLKNEAEALARKIEEEAEVLTRLRQPVQDRLEAVVEEAVQGLPQQPAQEGVQPLYQAPLPEGGSLYQRLAELRGGIYGVASHQVSGSGEIVDQGRARIGSLYTQLQDIVNNIASHAVEGRKFDLGDDAKMTQALNQTMQAVEKLGEAYSGRFENLLNRAREYLSKQEDVYKVPGT